VASVSVNNDGQSDGMWRDRVRAHLEIGGWGSLTALAKALDEPERSLRRWLYEADSPPRHEVRLLLKISKVFGWPLWYLMDDTHPYPPPPELLEVYRLREKLRPDTRPYVLTIAARLVNETLATFLQSYVTLKDDLLDVAKREAQNLGMPGMGAPEPPQISDPTDEQAAK